MNPVSDGKTWAAAEHQATSPCERHAIVRAGIATNLDQVPPEEFLARVRANVLDHIANTEGKITPDG